MNTSSLPLPRECTDPSTRWMLGVFFSLFLMGGCCFLAVIVWADVLVPWRVNHHYQETTGVVLDKRVEQRSIGRIGEGDGYRPEILLQYQVDGKSYRTWTYDSPPGRRVHHYGGRADAQVTLDGFTVGQVYRCWYDPDEPGEAVLVRGYRHLWWLLFPWPFVLVGGLGLIWLLLTRTASVRSQPA
jgi:Protein of unknown function (DUF3592)